MIIEDYVLINKVNSGASSVEKYKVYKDGKYYLLRLFDARFMNSRYAALSNIETLYINGINVPNVQLDDIQAILSRLLRGGVD